MEIICVPAIVSVVYALIEVYKKLIAKENVKLKNIIPVIALILGGALGVAMFYLLPQYIVASNVWIALIVGLCSGLSAVGGNQIFKQLSKIGVEVKEEKEDTKDNETK